MACDFAPQPQWPEPLGEGVNYADCRIWELGYANINPTIERLLSDEHLMSSMRENNARYFDDYATPNRVAEYILGRLDQVGAAQR